MNQRPPIAGTCPTVVFCVGQTAAEVGLAVARRLSQRRLPCPAVVWDLAPDLEGRWLARPHATGADVQAGASAEELVARVIAGFLTVGDLSIALGTERPIALRLSVIASANEMSAPDLMRLSGALCDAGHRHAGARSITEAFLLLPHPTIANASETDAAIAWPLAPSPELTICWWLGRVNAEGLTLPEGRDSIEDLATILSTMLCVPPEVFPIWHNPLHVGPMHLSAGCAELAAHSTTLAGCLSDRQSGRLIRDLFLRGRGRVDHAAIRRRVWALMSQRGCAAAIEHVKDSPGGERIWDGLHYRVPDEVRRGEIRGIVSDLGEMMDRFRRLDLLEYRARFEQSGRHRLREVIAAIDEELTAVVEHGNGGLFEGLAFLEALTALLVEPRSVREGEVGTNLQELRRRNDAALAVAARWTPSTAAAESAAKVRALRHTMDGLERVDLVRPPALPPPLFGGVQLDGVPVDQRVASAAGEIDCAVRAWAQAAVDTESEIVRQLDVVCEAEHQRRNKATLEALDQLTAAADAWHASRFQLHALDDGLGRYLQILSARSRRTANEKLLRAEEALVAAARTLVSSYASMAQLSIDEALHAARASVLQDALRHVRDRHTRLLDAVAGLERLEHDLSRANPDAPVQRLSRAVAGSGDSLLLSSRLAPDPDRATDVSGEVSLLAACSLPVEVLVGRIKEHSDGCHRPLSDFSVEDLLRVLRRPTAWLEESVAWLKHASAPWHPPDDMAPADSAVVCAGENSPLGTVLRTALPHAVAIDEPGAPFASVIRLRCLQVPQPSNTRVADDD